MSDQATFAAFIEALNAHTKALNGFLVANKGGAATTDKPKTTAAADKPAGTTKPKGTKVTLEKLTETFGAYLSVKDKDEKKERAGNVKAISEHFGVERVSLLDESDYAKALGFLKQFEEGTDPFAEEGDEGDEGEESLV